MEYRRCGQLVSLGRHTRFGGPPCAIHIHALTAQAVTTHSRIITVKTATVDGAWWYLATQIKINEHVRAYLNII